MRIFSPSRGLRIASQIATISSKTKDPEADGRDAYRALGIPSDTCSIYRASHRVVLFPFCLSVVPYILRSREHRRRNSLLCGRRRGGREASLAAVQRRWLRRLRRRWLLLRREGASNRAENSNLSQICGEKSASNERLREMMNESEGSRRLSGDFPRPLLSRA